MTTPQFKDYHHHIQTLLQATLAAADPYMAVARHLQVNNNRLTVGQYQHNLADGRLFVISVGKAAVPMAQAVLEQVGKAAVFGGIIAKHLATRENLSLPAYTGNHPIPGEDSIAATAAVVQTLEEAKDQDLVLCLISGGASALFTRPRLPFAVWRQLNEALLASGCPIQGINTVRRQLDEVKAGGLARLAAPAKVISLILSDVIGNELSAIGSGPTVVTRETPADALAVLQQYRVASWLDTSATQTVRAGLETAAETAVSPLTNIIDNIVVGSIRQSAEAAAEVARSLGFQTRLLTARLEGEAREVGRFMAALAKDAPPVSATIMGGETTVTLRGKGRGGRNLETALAAAVELAGWPQRVIVSFATDGDDGPTGMAGAIVTGDSLEDRSAALNALNNNDSCTFFESLEAAGGKPLLIKTGPTGTNVNDLLVILHYEAKKD